MERHRMFACLRDRRGAAALLFLASTLCIGPAAQKTQSPDRWEKDIQAFEKRDKESPPPKHGILFVGSSSIRLWNVTESFPDLPVINRGFGGSQISDGVAFASRIVIPYAPKVIVFYAGDNDLFAGKTTETVCRDFQAFAGAVLKALPDTHIVFIAIKPSSSRWALWEKQQQANRLIREFIAKDKRLEYLDVAPAMLAPDGQPRAELFRSDKLHLNAEGYKLWNSLLRPRLKALMK